MPSWQPSGRLAHSGTMSLDPPIAHLGHWYLWIPYVIPVVVVLAASLHAFRQQRREDRDRESVEKSRP
jgi:cytochrome c-type biogenesis protein CcmH/NrfF